MEERRVVFVAGATQGIGQDLAGFLSDRYAVVPIARSLGHDLSRTGAAASLLAAHGAPWGWVHCPGDFLEKPLLAVTDAEWEQLLSSNLWSFVRAARTNPKSVRNSSCWSRSGARSRPYARSRALITGIASSR